MTLYTRKKLQEEANLVRENLDAQALAIFNDLMTRIPIPTSVTPVANVVEKDRGFIFKGRQSVLVCVSSEGALEQFKEEGDEIKKQQFPTYEETNRYCAGTKGLLELLVRYERVDTEKAIITATPDAVVYRNNRASCLLEDLKDSSYGNDRVVVVSIVYKDGFAAFTFQETVNH